MTDETLPPKHRQMLEEAQPVTFTACRMDERQARQIRENEAMWAELGEEDQRDEEDRWDS